MRNLDEIMSYVSLSEDYYPKMIQSEKDKIFSNCVNSKKQRNFIGKKTIVLFAAVIGVFAIGGLCLANMNLNNAFVEKFGVSSNQEKNLIQGARGSFAADSHDGISVTLEQTIADEQALYAIIDVSPNDDIIFANGEGFQYTDVSPADTAVYSSFGSDIEILHEDERSKKYLITASGNSGLTDGTIKIRFENFCGLKNGTKEVINGVWSVDFEYDKTQKVKTAETEVSEDVSAYMNSSKSYKTTTIKKITISPLSLSIDNVTAGAEQGSDNLFATFVEVNMDNGESFYCGKDDIRKKFTADLTGGNMFFRFDKIIDPASVKSITIGDKTIEMNN